jgi:serine/threonine protein kinase
MLAMNPKKRITASEAIKHVWFKTSPPPQSLELMPIFPAGNEIDRNERKKIKINHLNN